MPSIGTPELIIGLIVIFLLFGAKRMPEMARGIGQSLKIFKTEMAAKPADSDASNAVIVNPAPAPAQAPTAQAEAAQATPAPAAEAPSAATETPAAPAAAPAEPQARPAQ
ncbi:twin-arginine translocase TatA/TatE family subunit [Jiangella mangrovi]|uniref:Sec-independent protein translocase protein TatA n=1 Tax=Jiangella mangrovi TaxID=1524084 RepID=A0A7W9GMT5_9ACTN|nr:twin-arginine translocase TatA/TatE family subunit [Jiangella mangrovi]MBB5786592.1 sec-independent protein translocase protein TatA [Jiangella mangrovi]